MKLLEVKPEYYISRVTLEKLIAHYNRHANYRRAFRNEDKTERARDTLAALLELRETFDAEEKIQDEP